ncbi:MAG: DNA polymerase I [Anaerolineae bacterium]
MPDESTQRPRLILIDGHALAYRAFHALSESQLATSTGELTGGIFGFMQMLLVVLREHTPDYIAVTWDAGLSGRREEFAEYKTNRVAMPSDLGRQIGRIREVLDAFRIKSVELAGYEADDLIGTLALRASEDGFETLIVTGDSDTFQLVGPHVTVLTTRGRFSETIIYDEAALQARFALAPAQLIDFKALKGDTSDNVPGVPGVGDKTATTLLQKYHTIEGILAHLDEVKPPKVRESIERQREQLLVNKKLITIQSDVPLDVAWDDLRYVQYDQERVTELFRELEFRSLLARLPDRNAAAPAHATQPGLFETESADGAEAPKTGDYTLIGTPNALKELGKRLKSATVISFDTETTSTDAMRAELVGLALSTEEGTGAYIPIYHHDAETIDIADVVEALGPALADPAIPKVAHNANYDLMVLWNHGVEVHGELFDTMIAAWLLDPGRQAYGLKDMAWNRLGVEMTNIEELIGKGKDQITMAEVHPERVTAYASADVDMTLRLSHLQEKELHDKALWDLFRDVEMPLTPILTRMEQAGILLDVDYLMEMSREFHLRLQALEAEIYDLAGYPFNIGSTKQLASILFDQLGLPPQKRTSTGYSTDISVLEALRGQHPIIDKLVEHRQLAKLKSTYIDALPLLVNPRTGRVHTDFNQNGSATGRISSSNPNLQNIPIRTEEGRRIRRAFIAPPDHVLLTADYSQIELRILAAMTQEPTLLESFERGEDIHARTAALLFNIPIDQVTSAQRRIAKTTNFGIIYGISGFGLAARTDLTNEEARDFIQNYFAKLPHVAALQEEFKKAARRDGYVSTLLGRRRYFPALKSGARITLAERQRLEREAINAPVQGTAADIVKIAMIHLDEALREHGLAGRMLLQVHDELVLEVPKAELEETAAVVRDAMENAFALKVALKVDIAVGENWSEVEDIPAGG